MTEQLSPTELGERLGWARVTELNYYPIKSCAGSSVEIAEVVPTGIKHDREFMVVHAETGQFLTQRDYPAMATIIPRISDGVLSLEAPGTGIVEAPIVEEGVQWEAQVWRDSVVVVDQGNGMANWLSNVLIADVRLVHMAKGQIRQVDSTYSHRNDAAVGFADGYPFLLTSEESLSDLNGRLPSPVPMSRFRPNIVVGGSTIPFGEDHLLSFKIGEVTFHAVKPCVRCVVTTIDQNTGQMVLERDDPMLGEPLRTLASYRTIKYGLGQQGVMFGQNLIHDLPPKSAENPPAVVSVGDRVEVKQFRANTQVEVASG